MKTCKPERHAGEIFQAILVVASLSAQGSGSARAQPADAISGILSRCLSGRAGSTTAGQLDCIARANQAWDKRLNEVYGNLMQTLDPASRAQLQAAQRSWLEYRKKDAEFGQGPWRAQTGTLAEVTIATSRLEEMRARVQTLETYARGD